MTLSKLEASADFFTKLLGWQEVKRDNDYPAIFVSDGSIMVTLWQTQTDAPEPFNKNDNIGLHYVAFKVENESILGQLFEAFKRLKVFRLSLHPSCCEMVPPNT